MQNIIEPVNRKDIERELTNNRYVRPSNKGNCDIYIINHCDSPNVMREIGRLREVTFRNAGGGTGNEVDIDEFDVCDRPYQQLIVWDPLHAEIVGGYRFIRCIDAGNMIGGQPNLATSELFRFSDNFLQNYLPYTIELGRSFVQPAYQPSSNNRKGLFSLDNLWDGLGAIVINNPDIKYFFGKVTMYLNFNQKARDMILFFMNQYFPDNDKLVQPHHPLTYHHDVSEFEKIFSKDLPYKEAHAILNQHVRELGENIPPLINSYMNLSPNMRTFGTSLNDHFGEVEETGILVTISNIYPSKKERHINSYLQYLQTQKG